LNQRLITARKGVEWLEATGQIEIGQWGEERITIAAKTDRAEKSTRGEKNDRAGDEAPLVLSELKVLLAETAAWRGRYRYLKIEDVRELART
jgi:hypothetical protein